MYVAGKTDLSPAGYEGTFKRMEIQHKFKDVTCGFDMTAAFTRDNKLLVWGNNRNNQLGLPNTPVIKEPTELSLPDNEIPAIVKFGLKHTAILTTKSNHIFIIGMLKHFKNCKDAAYKVIDHNSIEWLQLILPPVDITHFTCGQNHISFVIHGHVIHGFGDNKFSQSICQSESLEQITKFESGWTHNGYVTDSNALLLYGRNNYGQLGNGGRDFNGIAVPQKCPIFPVNDFALGAEHGILVSGRDIYTWGWNEHRNCGHETDDDM